MNFGISIDWSAPVWFSSWKTWAFNYYGRTGGGVYSGGLVILGLQFSYIFDRAL